MDSVGSRKSPIFNITCPDSVAPRALRGKWGEGGGGKIVIQNSSRISDAEIHQWTHPGARFRVCRFTIGRTCERSLNPSPDGVTDANERNCPEVAANRKGVRERGRGARLVRLARVFPNSIYAGRFGLQFGLFREHGIRLAGTSKRSRASSTSGQPPSVAPPP